MKKTGVVDTFSKGDRRHQLAHELFFVTEGGEGGELEEEEEGEERPIGVGVLLFSVLPPDHSRTRSAQLLRGASCSGTGRCWLTAATAQAARRIIRSFPLHTISAGRKQSSRKRTPFVHPIGRRAGCEETGPRVGEVDQRKDGERSEGERNEKSEAP